MLCSIVLNIMRAEGSNAVDANDLLLLNKKPQLADEEKDDGRTDAERMAAALGR